MGASALVLASAPAAFAQEPVDSGPLPEVTVTAQKRAEDLQSVPLSIEALSTETLEEQHVSSFMDYAKLIPSVSFQGGSSSGGGGGPGFARVYMRGVASGGDGNHSASQPSVGMYLDEQPITTAQGALDVHIYDIARVEALAGPQGTLYGASSQAGTIRIISNKPDPTRFDAGYNLQVNTFTEGSTGGLGEGFVNIPLSSSSALRLVAWADYSPGFIDNVRAAPFTYSNGVAIDNADVVEDDYNDATTFGGRAALRIDLNDSWTVTPTFMGQQSRVNGVPGFAGSIGDLELTHYRKEFTEDSWYQAALTVEGKIGNFDTVYAGALMRRFDETHLDYTDYSIGYDSIASYFVDDLGDPIDPSQFIVGKDGYEKWSHELRFSSPQDERLRVVAGVFLQRQMHDIEQNYTVEGLAASLEVTGWEDTWWLTKQQRVDRDRAVFGEVSYDITPKLTATGGIRFFKSENTLQGFFGFGPGNPFASSFGEALCDPNNLRPFKGAPCTRLDKTVDDSGDTPKFNLSYRLDDRRMVYATWSRGFRPGGVNRNGAASPLVPASQQIYKPDFLTNYELGWKTSWLDERLRWNGAVFHEDWDDFQFSFLGENSVTVIRNAGQARIRGLESSLEWAAMQNLRLTGSMAWYDAELTEDYCQDPDDCANTIQAPAGTQLPVTPKFKANLTGRYYFTIGELNAFTQGVIVHQGSAFPDLRIVERGLLGEQEAFTTLDLSFGLQRLRSTLEFFVNNAFDERGALHRYGECTPTVCGVTYTLTNPPRTIGIKFGQNF